MKTLLASLLPSLVIAISSLATYAGDPNYLQNGKVFSVAGSSLLLTSCGFGVVEVDDGTGIAGIHRFGPRGIQFVGSAPELDGVIANACFDRSGSTIVFSTKAPCRLEAVDAGTLKTISPSISDELNRYHEILGVVDRDTFLVKGDGRISLVNNGELTLVARFKQRYGADFAAATTSNRLAAVFPSESSCGAVVNLDQVTIGNASIAQLEGFRYMSSCGGYASHADIHGSTGLVVALVRYFRAERCPQTDSIFVWTGMGELLDIQHVSDVSNCLDIEVDANSVSAIFGIGENKDSYSSIAVRSWDLSMSEGLEESSRVEIPLPFVAGNALLESDKDSIVVLSESRKKIVRFQRTNQDKSRLFR